MDPNANLQEQEELICGMATAGTYAAGDRARLRELRAALADWIRGGGFAPDWTQAPRASAWYGKGIDATVRAMPSARADDPPAWLQYRDAVRAFGALTFADRPLPWQAAGRQQTASGYGRRLTSTRMAILPDGRARRVYVTQYSNAGTAWIRVAGRTVIVSEGDTV